MNLEIDDAELLRLAQIEDEADCDISAGFDHGENLGIYLSQSLNSISYNQLSEILHNSFGNALSAEEIDKVVLGIQQASKSHLVHKSAKSA
ncbi:hypothetical protein [Pseudanabaena sp. Chao 1811]|uniref:hypothetical protein n=1 Tax=Pseudanabaena sp. Chao 1811 TaxID=2963092 RepID=UPI0022F3BE91|nr:hypothetical protein [Pseudanabaena sp. Chao 1811]